VPAQRHCGWGSIVFETLVIIDEKCGTFLSAYCTRCTDVIDYKFWIMRLIVEFKAVALKIDVSLHVSFAPGRGSNIA
jgi:hypothetical protein